MARNTMRQTASKMTGDQISRQITPRIQASGDDVPRDLRDDDLYDEDSFDYSDDDVQYVSSGSSSEGQEGDYKDEGDQEDDDGEPDKGDEHVASLESETKEEPKQEALGGQVANTGEAPQDFDNSSEPPTKRVKSGEDDQ